MALERTLRETCELLKVPHHKILDKVSQLNDDLMDMAANMANRTSELHKKNDTEIQINDDDDLPDTDMQHIDSELFNEALKISQADTNKSIGRNSKNSTPNNNTNATPISVDFNVDSQMMDDVLDVTFAIEDSDDDE